jgi:ABC-type branched-subunit amino acid transport system ATPase component
MLRLENLTRRFGETVAVDGVSLQVAAGEFKSHAWDGLAPNYGAR